MCHTARISEGHKVAPAFNLLYKEIILFFYGKVLPGSKHISVCLGIIFISVCPRSAYICKYLHLKFVIPNNIAIVIGVPISIIGNGFEVLCGRVTVYIKVL